MAWQVSAGLGWWYQGPQEGALRYQVLVQVLPHASCASHRLEPRVFSTEQGVQDREMASCVLLCNGVYGGWESCFATLSSSSSRGSQTPPRENVLLVLHIIFL